MLTAEDWHDPQNISHHVDRYFGTTGHQGPGNYFANTRNTAFYRDGKPYGRTYRKAPAATFEPEVSQVLFGCRHGTPYLAHWRTMSFHM